MIFGRNRLISTKFVGVCIRFSIEIVEKLRILMCSGAFPKHLRIFVDKKTLCLRSDGVRRGAPALRDRSITVFILGVEIWGERSPNFGRIYPKIAPK